MTTIDEAGPSGVDAVPVSPPEGPAHPPAIGRARAVAVIAWAAATACVVLTVLWRAGAGWDHIDEAFYLLTAAPPHAGDAYNGLSGPYLRGLWTLAGWDVAAVRILGGAVLVATAALVGAATARLLGHRPSTLVAVTIAAATGYYATLFRTPSYNWLAVVGAGLACTGALHLLARGSARWGALCGSGLCVAGAGKATTGLALVLVVGVVALRTRPRALAWAAVAALLAVVVHVVAVLPAGATLAVLARSSRHLAVLSPAHYTPTSAIVAVVVGALITTAVSLTAGGALGLLPLAAAPHPRTPRVFAVLAVVALVACVALTLVTRVWALDYWEAQPKGTGLLALLECLLVVALAGRVMRLEAGPARRPLAGAAVLVVAAAGCVAGSNVAFGFLLNMAGLLLAPACFCLVAALPRVAVPAAHVTVVAVVCAASLVAATAVARHPKWSGPLVDADTPVRLGPTTVRVDAPTARGLEALRSAAAREGWRPGTPLVDAAYMPSVVLALAADVPPVLLPGLAMAPAASVCSAVRGLGARWRDAWLLVPQGPDLERRRRIARYLGRRYPQDYRPVASFTDPFGPAYAVLLRPVALDTGPVSDQALATTCLGAA